ncbi:unnamed protein product [Rotaria sordida]|nr:unnamed protein product [Rotaria sordida]
MFTLNNDIINLFCAQFRSDGHGHIQIVYNGEHLINNIERIGENQDINKDICDYVEHHLNVVRFLNNNNEANCEKLVIMVIDNDSHISIDPLRVSNEFSKRHITLAIVACATPPFEIWDLYHTSAHNTGGKYMLLTDAPRILSHVISSVVTGKDTFRKAFLHMSRENVPTVGNIVGCMEKECETMNDMPDFDFDHGLSY